MSTKTTSFMFRLFNILIILVSLLSMPGGTGSVSAGTGVWTSNGPEGAIIHALAIDPAAPDILYAGAWYGGIYKSTNGGGNWSVINNGLTSVNVNTLAVDPTTSSTIYAGTNNGVFKTTNSGGNWSAFNNGLTNLYVNTLVIDPLLPSTLYAGTSGGIFKSVNSGNSWNAVNAGLTTLTVKTLAINPSAPDTLYAGTFGGGVFVSINGGGTWTASNTNLTDGNIMSLAIDPITPTTVYAGTHDGVFKSLNSGGEWNSINQGLLDGTWIYTLSIDPVTPTTIYAGTDNIVFVSSDGGDSWGFSMINAYVRAFAIDPATPTTLYAGTEWLGVFKMTQESGNWIAINNGLNAAHVNALAIDPVTQTTVYAGIMGGVFKSMDSGESWLKINTGLTNVWVNALAIDPSEPSTIYAGTFGGVYKSMDGGGIWSLVNTGLTTPVVVALAIDPLTPDILYAATNVGGVFKSMNGGGSWNAINNGLTNLYTQTLAVDPGSSTTIYAGTGGGGVFKSTDGGGNWTEINSGLTGSSVYALAITPSLPDLIYAGTNGGVFKSTDGGNNWNPVSVGLPLNAHVRALAIDPSMPTTLYAGTDGDGGKIYKTIDGGEYWNVFNNGLSNTPMLVLAIDSTAINTIYAGTLGGSVASFSNKSSPGSCGSGTWTYGNLEIHHINIGQGDSTLIVGPTGRSLLFDAGETNWNSSAKAQIIGPYIEDVLGCKSLDYVVISHFHLDHIGYVGYGGLYHLVENQAFTVGSTLVRDYDTYLGDSSGTFTNWNAYLEGAGQTKLHPVTALEGISQVNLGTGVTFDVVTVDGNGAIIPGNFSGDASPPSENDYSIGAVISYGDFDEWIGGDLDGQYEVGGFGYTYHDIELSVAPEVGDVDVYKANHHASSHSSSATFVNQIDPEISIVTAGDGNTYGHPTQSIMDRLLATSTVYMTERGDTNTDIGSAIVAGNIVIKTLDGSAYTVNGTSYTATEPIRMDLDGDGYFVEADPNDGASDIIPAPNGGCGAIYQTCSVSCEVNAGQVVINEILPAPSNGIEWVELYNATNNTLNLGYCYIDDIAGGSSAYQIPSGTLIPAHGFWTLDRTSYFNNTGDDARLLDDDGTTVLDSYSFGSTATDQSWYRFPDGGNWAVSSTLMTTKGHSNNTPFAPFVLTTTRMDMNPTNATSVDFAVTFSEPVSGVSTDDFNLYTTGVIGATITSASGSDASYTVSVNTGSGSGTIRLDVVDNNSIIDGTGNSLGGTGLGDGNFVGGEEYTIYKVPTPTPYPGVVSHARDFSTPFIPPGNAAVGMLPVLTKSSIQGQSAIVSTPTPTLTIPISTPQPVFAEVRSIEQPISAIIVVGTTEPETTLLHTPGNPSRQRFAFFTYASTPAGTFICSLDGSAYFACEHSIRFVGLSDGMHVFEVRAVDEAGNYDNTPVIFTWTVERKVNIQRFKQTQR